MSDNLVKDYQRAALCKTLLFALEHPFYQRKWGDRVDAVLEALRSSGEVDISGLPILHKPELQSQLSPRVSSEDQIRSVIHTTGSTGPLTYRFRGQHELESIARYAEEAYYDATCERRPLVYLIYGPYHGQSEPSSALRKFPNAPYCISGAVWEDIFIYQGVDLLRRSFDVDGLDTRVTQIHGAVRLLRVFTQCMMDLGVNASETAVTSLVSFAGYLPKEVRGFLSRYWRSEPIEMYSFSEMMGGAVKCPKCGALQFDAHIYPETVGLSSDEVVHEGVGRLVTSELFPFGTTQPLIRYYSGDLVRIEKGLCSCCGRDTRLVHIGRDNEGGVDLAAASVYLGSSDLREAAYSPFVARSTEYPHLNALKDRESHLGVPIVAATLRHKKNDIPDVEVRFRPRLAAYSPRDAATGFRDLLMQSSRELSAKVSSGACTVSVIPDEQCREKLWK